MSTELHCHTFFSIDGHGTPEELVDVASERGVTTLAITEHDSLYSIPRGQARAKEKGIRFIPAFELSAEFKEDSFHFIALGIDPENQGIIKICEKHEGNIDKCFAPMMQGLVEKGYDISMAEMEALLPARYPGHPSPKVAQWFTREHMIQKGIFKNDAVARKATGEIRKEIVANGKAISPEYVSLEEGLKAVHEAGGILLIAHVGLYYPGDKEKQFRLLEDILDLGLDGFELYHPHNLSQPHFEDLVSYREKRACAASGGSDCHWAKAQNTGSPGIGEIEISAYVVDTIDTALEKVRS